MLSKTDTIDAIRRLNPTASPAFLVEFSCDDLVEYLGRLTTVSRVRHRCDPPERPTDGNAPEPFAVAASCAS